MTHEPELELSDEQLAEAVGGQGVTGRITGIASDPADSAGTVSSSGANTLLASTYGRGVFAIQVDQA